MNLKKPEFWDYKKPNFFAYLLLPFSYLLIIYNFLTGRKKNKINNIKTICVGNIYVGGTGKTPLCIEIFSILKKLNKNPVFVRKKYKSFQDEINLLNQTGSVYESKKRTNALNKIDKNDSTVAILDDGFQDFSIKKDLSIVCFDEKLWIGNGFVIPSGPLRENLSALKRAACVMIKGKKNLDIEKIIYEKNKKIKIFYSKYMLKNSEKFKNRKVIGFAGIGNPKDFFNLLKDSGIILTEEIRYPDHYNYTDNDIKNLMSRSKNNNAILITTEKDYLRINQNYQQDINYLKVKIEIENRNDFVEEIKKIL